MPFARPSVNPPESLEARPANDPPLVGLLRALVSDEPQGACLYQVQWGDRPVVVVRKILASCGIARPTRAQVDEYFHILAGGRYNSTLYGSASSSVTYPSRWLVPGLGLGLRAAWLPRNEDALDLYLRGQAPQCVIDRRTGCATSPATSRGMIWAPPVELLGREITTETHQWDDGSPVLDPPLAIMESITNEL